MLKEEFGEKVDFSIKKGEKIKVSVGGEGKKEKKSESGGFPAQKYLTPHLVPSISTSTSAAPQPRRSSPNLRATTTGPTSTSATLPLPKRPSLPNLPTTPIY
jgi:hypothetical protein